MNPITPRQGQPRGQYPDAQCLAHFTRRELDGSDHSRGLEDEWAVEDIAPQDGAQSDFVISPKF